MRITPPVAHDQSGQCALLDVGERRRDADALLGEGLAAWEGEVGLAAHERGEGVRRFGLHVGKGAVGPIAGVVSITGGSSRGSMPIRAATASAVSRARRSGLHHSSASSLALARSASSAAWARPVSSVALAIGLEAALEVVRRLAVASQ